MLLWLLLAALTLMAVLNLVLYLAQRWERMNNRDFEMAVHLKASQIALETIRLMTEEGRVIQGS